MKKPRFRLPKSRRRQLFAELKEGLAIARKMLDAFTAQHRELSTPVVAVADA